MNLNRRLVVICLLGVSVNDRSKVFEWNDEILVRNVGSLTSFVRVKMMLKDFADLPWESVWIPN